MRITTGQMSAGVVTPHGGWRLFVWFVWFVLLALTYSRAHAQATVGQVEYTQGIASAQNGTATPRIINKGDIILEGDVISTGARSFAVIAFNDGGKITLRPSTIFAVESYNQTKGSESATLRLFKGGLRAITGAIGRANPRSVQVNTVTSTLGIRGTSFDERICEADCAKELRPGQKPPIPAAQIVARVAALTGSSEVIDAKGQSRPVVLGTPLVSGETLRTGKGAWAVLAFRDQSKVTVISESEFKLEDVRFTPKFESGSFVVRILRGGARAMTGLMAKRDPGTVKFNTATATLGIRGTGFDQRIALDCVAPGNCAEALFSHVWEGSVAIETGTQSLLIPLGRAGVFNLAQGRLVLLDAVPQFFLDEPAPRPDTVPVDFDNLFGVINLEGAPPGVYSYVRDGHVYFSGRKGGIDLGPGEAGYLAEGSDIAVRLSNVPRFMLEDPIPAPEDLDEKTLRLLDVLNPGGKPGDLVCEI